MDGLLGLLIGVLAGVVGLYMWKVPAADFCKPVCSKCRGSGRSQF
jgi:hypothetical protein